MMLLSLSGCGSTLPDADNRTRFVEALHALPDGEQAMRICETLDEPVRSDCVVAAVEASPLHPAAADWCATIVGVPRYECRFQLAERRHDLHGCDEAGPFTDDCKLHIFSASLDDIWPNDATFTDGAARVRAHLATAGLPTTDLRYWSAAFRHGLLRRRPFDRSVCAAMQDPTLIEACRHTGIAVYHNLLNHERDFGRFRCDGGALPPTLAYHDDPELDAIITERRATDLCKPGR